MPRTNLGRNISGMALAGLLALLAGCVPPTPPPAAARANLHNAQDNASLPPQGSNPPSDLFATAVDVRPDRGWLFVPWAFGQRLGRRLVVSLSHRQPRPPRALRTPMSCLSGPPAWRRQDPAPALPYREQRSRRTAAGLCGPGPLGADDDRPRFPTPKKSDEDDEWDLSHLAPDYTWKKFKEAVG